MTVSLRVRGSRGGGVYQGRPGQRMFKVKVLSLLKCVRYSTKEMSTRISSNKLNFEKKKQNTETSSSLTPLTSGQIEEYKRKLYDMIRKRNESEKVEEMTRFLIEECEPNLHLYNVILKCQLMKRNVEGIKEVLLLIAKNKFSFNSVTLNLLLVYYRDLDMMEEAEKLFDAMENRGKDANPLINCAGPNLAAYTTMIAGWGRRGNFEKAKQYYENISNVAEGGLRADEHANCAMLNAAVNTGNLEYAKKLFESMKQVNFIALKLWLRAALRLGGEEEAFRKLILKAKEEDEIESLEIGEFIKWTLNDFKAESKGGLGRIGLFLLESGLTEGIRIGDPQCLHSLLDAIKKDPESLKRLYSASLRWNEKLLPVIGGRLLHQLVSNGWGEMAGSVLGECKKLGVHVPPGLVNDCETMLKK